MLKNIKKKTNHTMKTKNKAQGRRNTGKTGKEYDKN